MSSTSTSAWRPFPRAVADLLCVGEAAGEMPPRIHPQFGLVVVRSPATVRLESSRSVAADAGHVFLVPAWQLHAVRSWHAGEEGPFTLLLGASELEGLAVPETPLVVADAELGEELVALAGGLRRPMQSVERADTVRSLVEHLSVQGTQTGAPRARPAAARLLRVRNHLRGHLAESLKTAELARLGGLTESHLIRAFHREFGLPPHAYQVRLRLAAAAELLRAGLPVSTAAYECGFADQSHLSRKYREVYGMTPAAWAAAVADVPREHRPAITLRSFVGPVARAG